MPAHPMTVLDMLVLLVLAGEIGASALIDARERRFPHGLSAAFALTCAMFGVLRVGPECFAWHVLAAAAAMVLLLATETLWRRVHGGSAGLGGGDIKFLAALMLADPSYALASFTLGLCLLAGCGLLMRRDALPLLPFAAAGCALVAIFVLLPWR